MTEQEMPHHVIINTIRDRIMRRDPHNRSYLLDEFDKANENYIRAKTNWSLSNTDDTMIALIGAWARLGRIINKARLEMAI